MSSDEPLGWGRESRLWQTVAEITGAATVALLIVAVLT